MAQQNQPQQNQPGGVQKNSNQNVDVNSRDDLSSSQPAIEKSASTSEKSDKQQWSQTGNREQVSGKSQPDSVSSQAPSSSKKM